MRSRKSSTSSRLLRPRLLDPTNDLVFKLLLTGPRSHEVLRFVLEAVLGPTVPIEDFVVADPSLRPTERDEKEIVFDVRVTLRDGAEIDIEMQCRPKPGQRDRLVYYGARGLAMQLSPGDEYEALRPSIVIAFLGYREFDDGRFHKRFVLAEERTHEVLSRALEVHTVELPALPLLDTDPAARHDPLAAFARFLTARTEAELEAISAEFPAMKKASDILAEISSDAAVRRRAAEREDRLELDAMYQRGAVREAREEGRVEGRAEGRVEGDAVATTNALLLVLEARFGVVPAHVQARIEAASVTERREMIARAARVASLEEWLGE